MSAKIGFEQLKIECIIGVWAHERVTPQTIWVDLKVGVDIKACVKSDDCSDTVDYVLLADLCTKIAQEGEFKLLESYAQAVCDTIAAKYPVSSVWIRAAKPSVIPEAKCAFVEVNYDVDISNRSSSWVRSTSLPTAC